MSRYTAGKDLEASLLRQYLKNQLEFLEALLEADAKPDLALDIYGRIHYIRDVIEALRQEDMI